MVKILIADDDLEIQELIKFTLENEGYQVVVASDGEEALKKVPKEKPDLIILDVMMPKLTGYEVCEKIRNNPLTSLIPIIMLTSLTQVKDRITGIILGADEYLCKPFEPLELAVRVEGLLRRVRKDISANPLTGLPGNVSLEDEIKNRIEKRVKFALLYLDIDNFKPFNDKYGFDKGDNIIRLTGGLLRSCLGEIGGSDTFISHLASEDFIIIVPSDRGEELAKKIINSFDNIIPTQYDKNVQKEGFMLLIDKLSISIGIASVDSDRYKHHSEVIERAKEMWKTAKSQSGSTYVLG